MATNANGDLVADGATVTGGDGIKPMEDVAASSKSDNQTHDATDESKKRSGIPLQNGPPAKSPRSDSIMNKNDKDGSIKQNYIPRSRFINLMVRDEHGNMVQVQGGGEPPLTTAALVECEENGM
eukprot:scaffold92797_cov36-Cyclotella_meneghiniana.AAC.1